MEDTHLYTILTENKILGYFRYVDDILIMYNEEDTDIEPLLNQFNNMIPTMHFSKEKETINSINFLDITIQRAMTTSPSVFIEIRPPQTQQSPKIRATHKNKNEPL